MEIQTPPPTPPQLPTEKPKKSGSFNWIGLLSALVVAGVVKFALSSVGRRSANGSDSGKGYYSDADLARATKNGDYEKTLRITAELMNEKLPRTLDKITTMDSVSAGPGMVFTYNYTIFTMAKDEMDMAQFEGMRAVLTKAYKDEPDMKAFRDAKVELRYNYNDKNHQLIKTFTITPKDFDSVPAPAAGSGAAVSPASAPR
ncbi:MAG TPA: hypothetical protein VGE67_08625 [Haloferula sp.]